MQPPFPVTFKNGLTAEVTYLADAADIPVALQQFGLATACPTLVIVGGASGLSVEDFERLRSLFKEVVCPFAAAKNFAIIDGGTDAGVMQLMGQSRAETGGQFPLIGVVVEQKAILPASTPPSGDAAALEPYHTHFLLVPGQEWGEESPWIAQVATTLSAGQPSLTLLINGGAIALHQDVPNSLEQERPVLVIGGSGRSADRLALAMTGQKPDPEVQGMIDSGLLHTVDLTVGIELLRAALQRVFASVNHGANE
ncbi:MAG: hypothetical protein NW220_01435 [Leptolyngbyaceae cyanobacterium bins.349]|nr:hypothetical protein [Leptolyngbyaceae cyanobacterium bins.349]